MCRSLNDVCVAKPSNNARRRRLDSHRPGPIVSDPRQFWNEKFSAPGYIYGEAPNDFLRERATSLQGPILSLGEGEGRNAVFLAKLGLDVTALDISEVGLAKTAALAARHGVSVKTVLADLSTHVFLPGRWGAVVSIWCHLPAGVRSAVHRGVAQALVPGGRLVLEAYTPRQLAFHSGGPRSVDMLYEPEAFRSELPGLDVELLEERERQVDESELHRGLSAVVRVVARRPLVEVKT